MKVETRKVPGTRKWEARCKRYGQWFYVYADSEEFALSEIEIGMRGYKEQPRWCKGFSLCSFFNVVTDTGHKYRAVVDAIDHERKTITFKMVRGRKP